MTSADSAAERGSTSLRGDKQRMRVARRCAFLLSLSGMTLRDWLTSIGSRLGR